MSWDADKLLTCAIDDIEDGGVTVGWRELFDEVEGDRMLRSGRDRELLDESEWLVSRVLIPFARDAAVNKIFDVSTDIRPCIISSEKVEGSILAGVSCSRMIVLELENAGSKIAGFGTSVGDVNAVVN